MKNKILFLMVGIILIPFYSFLNAQDCNLYFPDKVGAMREMKNYDAKNKLISIARQEIIDRKVSGESIEVKVKTVNLDDKDKELLTAEFVLLCEDGVFKMDMQSLLDPNTLAAYKDMDIEITGDHLEYSSKIREGDKLPDGNLKMVVKNQQLTLLTISVAVTNRNVEGKESISTDAGTFSCHKIRYDVASKVGFITITGSVVEWIAEGVGVVKSETFNKRGKSEGYSVLSAFKN